MESDVRGNVGEYLCILALGHTVDNAPEVSNGRDICGICDWTKGFAHGEDGKGLLILDLGDWEMVVKTSIQVQMTII